MGWERYGQKDGRATRGVPNAIVIGTDERPRFRINAASLSALGLADRQVFRYYFCTDQGRVAIVVSESGDYRATSNYHVGINVNHRPFERAGFSCKKGERYMATVGEVEGCPALLFGTEVRA